MLLSSTLPWYPSFSPPSYLSFPLHLKISLQRAWCLSSGSGLSVVSLENHSLSSSPTVSSLVSGIQSLSALFSTLFPDYMTVFTNYKKYEYFKQNLTIIDYVTCVWFFNVTLHSFLTGSGDFLFLPCLGRKRGWCVCIHLYSLVRYLKLAVLKFLNGIGIVFSQVHNFWPQSCLLHDRHKMKSVENDKVS